MNSIRLLLVMSVSGSLMIFLYWATKISLEGYFPIEWKKLLLKASIVFFLLPLPVFKNYFLDVWRTASETGTHFTIVEKIAQFQNDNIIYAVGDARLSDFYSRIILMVLLVVWVIGFIKSAFRLVRTYFDFKKLIRFYTNEVEDEKLIALLHRQKADVNVTKDVVFRYCDHLDSPLTLGLMTPIVLVPQSFDFTDECLAYALKHEVVHIKRMDFLFKILGMAVKTIHWFNPLAKLLLEEYEVLCECECDKVVVSNLSRVEREKYGNMILTLASEKDEMDFAVSPVSMFSYSSGSSLRERMEVVRDSKPTTKIQVLISIIAIMMVMLMSSFTVFAYSEQRVVENDPTVTVDSRDTADFVIVDTSDVEEEAAVAVFDAEMSYVEDDNGTLINYHLQEERAFCNHTFVNGKYIKHYSYTDGSCKQDYYYCQACDKCGYTIVGDYYNTVTYRYCEHK